MSNTILNSYEKLLHMTKISLKLLRLHLGVKWSGFHLSVFFLLPFRPSFFIIRILQNIVATYVGLVEK